MAKTPKKPTTEEEKRAQHAKFVEAAKAAECDDDEQRFTERVKKVAKQPKKGSGDE